MQNVSDTLILYVFNESAMILANRSLTVGLCIRHHTHHNLFVINGGTSALQ
jgi:hypothetical protein